MTRTEIKKNIQTCLEDAEWHLKLAEKGKKMGAPNRIIINSCVMSLIRATDCLCWLFEGKRCDAGRSHSLHKVFTELYDKGGLPEKYSRYRNTIRKWVATEKIKAQYQGQTYNQTDINRAMKQTKRYLNKCVKQVLRDRNIMNDLKEL